MTTENVDEDHVPVSRFGMKTELDQLRQYATAVSSVSEGGMAAVYITYDPYAGAWIIKVDWSDSTYVRVVNEDIVEAVTQMRKQLATLHAERLAIRQKES